MKGSCLCRKVKFDVKQFVPHTTNCYCSMCQKFHGAAYATFAVVHIDDLDIYQGEDSLQTYVADNGSVRTFCGNCGSSLFFQGQAGGSDIDVALGVMDDDPKVVPEANIFTSSKAKWVEITDELPVYRDGHDLNK